MKNINFIVSDNYTTNQIVEKLLRLEKTKKYNFLYFDFDESSDKYRVIAYSRNPITKKNARKEWEKVSI